MARQEEQSYPQVEQVDVLTPQEIERKFLITTVPENLHEFPSVAIHQGYISTDSEHEVRLRQRNDTYFQTVKVGVGEVRGEYEIPLQEDQFSTLWPLTEGKRVEKQRYSIPYDDQTIELDIYTGNLTGLVVAEVEFESKEKSTAFVAPFWFGEDVTGISEYKNSQLALKNSPPPEEAIDVSNPLIIEASLQEGVGNLIERIREESLQVGTPLLVHIAGRTSAGKTTAVTHEITQSFGERASILSMDDYSNGNAYIQKMADSGQSINWDHPDYMDFTLLSEHLQALKAGEPIEKPVFSFKTGEREGTELFQPTDVIIVEGLFALRDEIAAFGDIKAFVDISLHGSIVRRLLRDVQRTTMQPDQILRYYLETVEPMYQEHIAQTKENADFVLLNEYNPKNEAGRSGMFEAQAKFQGSINPEMMRKAGAEMLGVVKQQDMYFNPKGRSLQDSGESVRIRREEGRSVLSYKGPQMGEHVRVRPKFEFEIDSATEKVFLDAYGDDLKHIDKTRRLYKLGEAIVSLDTVTKQEDGVLTILGNFIEVRYDRDKAEEQMHTVCQQLGLDASLKITRSYAEM